MNAATQPDRTRRGITTLGTGVTPLILCLLLWIAAILSWPESGRWDGLVTGRPLGLARRLRMIATPRDLYWNSGRSALLSDFGAIVVSIDPITGETIETAQWADPTQPEQRAALAGHLQRVPEQAVTVVRLTPYIKSRVGGNVTRYLERLGMPPGQDDCDVLLVAGRPELAAGDAVVRAGHRLRVLINPSFVDLGYWVVTTWLLPITGVPLLVLILAICFSRRHPLAGTLHRQGVFLLPAAVMLAAGPLALPRAMAVIIACCLFLLAEAKACSESRFENWAVALRVFAVSRTVLLFAVVIGASWFHPLEHQAHYRVFGHDMILDSWVRWDSEYFLSIALHGYDFNPQTEGLTADFPNSILRSNNAFFPLYPWLIRLAAPLIPALSPLRAAAGAGLLISNLAFLAALAMLHVYARRHVSAPAAERCLWYVALFPTSFFFSAVYSESLFLLLTIAAFLLVEQQRYLAAGVMGGLASLTRLVGMTLLTVFAGAIKNHGSQAGRRGGGHRPARAILLTMTPTILGLLIFSGVLWVRTGDPLGFYTSQHIFGNLDGARLDLPWSSIPSGFDHFRNGGFGTEYYDVRAAADFVFTAVFLLLTIPVWKRFGAGVGLFHLACVLVPSIAMLRSLARYCGVLFPAFMVMAEWGENRTVDAALRAGFTLFLAIFAIIFATWRFIA
ncbi:hypothetical protein JW905_08785 [bacterium]|nr:hypothetical protein [candidate division CSSED10-310 bacterium]